MGRPTSPQLEASQFGMGRIIHCADLVLKVDDDAVIGNLSQWIMESTEFRPTNMETCTIRDEMSTYQKLWLILVVWLTLVLLSFLYCYFCEQRLFQGSQRLFDRSQVVDEKGLLANGKCPNEECNLRYKRF